MLRNKGLLTPQFGCDPIRLGLFPLRSPLLGESQLFSFPPLNDMLKFSGWSPTVQALKSDNSEIGTKTNYLRALFVPNTIIGTEPWTCSVIHRHAFRVQRFDNTLDSAIHTNLSHIAASFIDWEAKTSTVMSCSKSKNKFKKMNVIWISSISN